jgi:hypothetical protein
MGMSRKEGPGQRAGEAVDRATTRERDLKDELKRAQKWKRNREGGWPKGIHQLNQLDDDLRRKAHQVDQQEDEWRRSKALSDVRQNGWGKQRQ